jgi:hypothetical protein
VRAGIAKCIMNVVGENVELLSLLQTKSGVGGGFEPSDSKKYFVNVTPEPIFGQA